VATSKIIDFEAGKAAVTDSSSAGTSSAPANRSTGTANTMRSDLVQRASKIVPEAPLLINMVSRRVKQLNMGRSPLVQPEPRMGVADIALLEIIEGKVVEDDESETGK